MKGSFQAGPFGSGGVETLVGFIPKFLCHFRSEVFTRVLFDCPFDEFGYSIFRSWVGLDSRFSPLLDCLDDLVTGDLLPRGFRTLDYGFPDYLAPSGWFQT